MVTLIEKMPILFHLLDIGIIPEIILKNQKTLSEGIIIKADDETEIINYPEQHIKKLNE